MLLSLSFLRRRDRFHCRPSCHRLAPPPQISVALSELGCRRTRSAAGCFACSPYKFLSCMTASKRCQCVSCSLRDPSGLPPGSASATGSYGDHCQWYWYTNRRTSTAQAGTLLGLQVAFVCTYISIGYYSSSSLSSTSIMMITTASGMALALAA